MPTKLSYDDNRFITEAFKGNYDIEVADITKNGKSGERYEIQRMAKCY